MGDVFEKKIKSFLPYIIITAAAYYIVPAILMLSDSAEVVNQIVYIGLFSLIAFGCCLYHGLKKTNDLTVSLVAPVLFIPSMFIFGVFSENWTNALLFLVSYFICGFIGVTIGDMLRKDKAIDQKLKEDNSDERPYVRKRVPKRVATAAIKDKTITEKVIEEHDIEIPESFEAEENIDDVETTFDTTVDDIDAILAELRNRTED